MHCHIHGYHPSQCLKNLENSPKYLSEKKKKACQVDIFYLINGIGREAGSYKAKAFAMLEVEALASLSLGS